MPEKNENEILKRKIKKKTKNKPKIRKVVGLKCYLLSILHMPIKFQHNRFVNKKKFKKWRRSP